jgi:hypothetical protein
VSNHDRGLPADPVPVAAVVHVSLVFTTGLMRDLNHIYAGRNDDSWVSFWIFVPRRVLAARVTGGAV